MTTTTCNPRTAASTARPARASSATAPRTTTGARPARGSTGCRARRRVPTPRGVGTGRARSQLVVRPAQHARRRVVATHSRSGLRPSRGTTRVSGPSGRATRRSTVGRATTRRCRTSSRRSRRDGGHARDRGKRAASGGARAPAARQRGARPDRRARRRPCSAHSGRRSPTNPCAAATSPAHNAARPRRSARGAARRLACSDNVAASANFRRRVRGLGREERLDLEHRRAEVAVLGADRVYERGIDVGAEVGCGPHPDEGRVHVTGIAGDGEGRGTCAWRRSDSAGRPANQWVSASAKVRSRGR